MYAHFPSGESQVLLAKQIDKSQNQEPAKIQSQKITSLNTLRETDLANHFILSSAVYTQGLSNLDYSCINKFLYLVHHKWVLHVILSSLGILLEVD